MSLNYKGDINVKRKGTRLKQTIVKEDFLAATEWRLGRVNKVYPGKDNKVRVADIRTQHGVITRPVVKLCILPQFFEPKID